MTLTETQHATCVRALQRTWQAIAPDAYDEGATTAEIAVELCVDAGRARMYANSDDAVVLYAVLDRFGYDAFLEYFAQHAYLDV